MYAQGQMRSNGDFLLSDVSESELHGHEGPLFCLPEGVQLLCLIDKAADACRYLQTYGEWTRAAWLAKVGDSSSALNTQDRNFGLKLSTHDLDAYFGCKAALQTFSQNSHPPILSQYKFHFFLLEDEVSNEEKAAGSSPLQGVSPDCSVEVLPGPRPSGLGRYHGYTW